MGIPKVGFGCRGELGDTALEVRPIVTQFLKHLVNRLRGRAAWARPQLLRDGTSGQVRYHALRVALARWWKGPTTLAPPDPKDLARLVGSDLTAIVIALDAQSGLVDAVRSLDLQVPRPEIIVVNSGVSGAHALLRSAGLQVTVVESSRRLYPGAARNVGIAAAHGKYLAFLAADCVAHPGWVACRLHSHQSGADLVSSAVVNGNPWNPFSAAAHVLLFATRLPGTSGRQRRYCGASYRKDLFAQYGFFSTELRAGEDTEFDSRLEHGVAQRFDARVHTAHRNPRTPWTLMLDQYRRGRRSAQVLRSLGLPTPTPTYRQMGLLRASKLAPLAISETPGSSWLQLLWAMPWIYPASLAYVHGFRRALRLPLPDPLGTHASNGRKRLVALLQFHNDHSFLPGYLQNVSEQVDGILALDDGSDPALAVTLGKAPKVLEVLTIPARSPHLWDERRNQRLLVDAARRHRAEWLIALDTDERLERDFRQRADPYLAAGDRRGVVAYDLILRELWGSPDRFRIDGIWGRKRRPRLFRTRDDHGQGDTELHGIWAPLDRHGKRSGFIAADLILYHLAMITAEQRQARRAKYERLDPDTLSQRRGYAYLTDESGLTLSALPEGRDFIPNHAPP